MNKQPDHNYLGDMMNTFPSAPVTTELIQKMLEENRKLILAILDNQSLGRLQEIATYQARLQNNLMYLAAIADAQSAQTLPVSSNLTGRRNPTLQPSQLQNHLQQQQMANHLRQQQMANHLQQQQNHLQRQQIANHLQQQQQQQNHQMLNQSILGKDSTLSSMLPMHCVTQNHQQQQQQQQYFFHASSPSLFNPNSQLEMGMPSLNSSGSFQDLSSGFTSNLTGLDQVISDHGDPNTSRGGGQDSDTYLTLPEDGN